MMKFGRARASRDFGIAVILLAPFWFIGTLLIAIPSATTFTNSPVSYRSHSA